MVLGHGLLAMDSVESLFSVTEDDITSEEDESITKDSEIDTKKYYCVQKEKSLSLDRLYVLYLCAAEEKNVFASLSDKTSVVYDVETFVETTKFIGHTNTITGIKVCPDDNNLIFTSSMDGTVKMWDVRLNKNFVHQYQDSSEGDNKLKPLTSFDISPKKPLIVAGSEQFDGEAYLLFWDKRSTKLLGGYWESHEDDITQVCFLPSNSDCIATGSTDGLINVFDLGQDNEEDSLLYSLNTESSVDKLVWFGHSKETSELACTTHTEDLQLWRINDAAPYAKFSRDKITNSIQRKRTDLCYISDVLNIDNTLCVLAGSLFRRGECLQLLKSYNNEIELCATFCNNKQVVRSCIFYNTSDVFVTGGESGLLTMWKQRSDVDLYSSDWKIQTKLKDHSASTRKPY